MTKHEYYHASLRTHIDNGDGVGALIEEMVNHPEFLPALIFVICISIIIMFLLKEYWVECHKGRVVKHA
jgi:hypothetical protein